MSDIISGKLEIAVLIDSLQAAVGGLLALLQLYGPLKRNSKIKGKTAFYFQAQLAMFLFKNLTS